MEQSIKLSEIRIDGGTQTRAAINDVAVEEYAADMQDGSKFPAVIIFNDGANKWLADGFHRFHASSKAGFLDILADVRTGTRADAVKYALGANRSNGLRRTNPDKRRCVEIALDEFRDLSDRAIAEMCGVGNQMVGDVRRQVCESHTSSKTTTRTGIDGKQYPASKPPKAASRTAAPEPIVEPDPEPEEDLAPTHDEDCLTGLPATNPPASSAFNPDDFDRPEDGIKYADQAIVVLKRIKPHDKQRAHAAKLVINWINKNLV